MPIIKEENYVMDGYLYETEYVHQRSRYWKYQDHVVEDVDVTVETAKNCVDYPAAKKVGSRIIVLKAGFKVRRPGDRFRAAGTLLATLSEYPGSRDISEDVRTEEVVFVMKGAAPGQITPQTREMKDKILECHLLEVISNNEKGGDFSARKTGEKTIECSGGFYPEPGSEGPFEAKVKVLAVMEE